MTPPPAASHAAPSRALAFPPVADRVTRSLARALEPRSWSRLRLLVDTLVLSASTSAAVFAAPAIEVDPVSRWLAAAFPVLVLVILHARPSPDDRMQGSFFDAAANVLRVVSLSAMLIVALDSILGGVQPASLPLRLWLFALVYLGVARTVLLSVRRQALRVETLATPTLIVGAGRVGEHLVKRLAREPRYGLHPVGFLDSDPLSRSNPTHSPGVSVLGGSQDLADAVERTGARKVILAFSSEPDHVLVEKAKQCHQLGVEVALVPRLYESINERCTLDHIGGLPLVSLRPTNPRDWQFAIKHAIDRGVSALALLTLAPLLLAISIAVRATSPGPVLFRQRRVGRDGRVFDVLKFRTMRNDIHAGAFELRDGCAPGGIEGIDRRTPLGRVLRSSSLDELPQLLNVLRGDMSLVGPRPERPEFVEMFSSEVDRYDDRHRVKSGISGLAQVSGLRGQTSIADRVEWDNHYIQNWSLRLDLRILALTVIEVLRFRELS